MADQMVINLANDIGYYYRCFSISVDTDVLSVVVTVYAFHHFIAFYWFSDFIRALVDYPQEEKMESYLTILVIIADDFIVRVV